MTIRVALALISICLFAGANSLIENDSLKAQDPGANSSPTKQRVTRAKRPTFSKRQWEGIFFENLFLDGLQGARPANFGLSNDSLSPATTPSTAVAETAPEGESVSSWSAIVTSDTIENEIKRLHSDLSSQITTADTYGSKYRDAQVSFSILSVLFAVIHEYEQSVRWKNDALQAQAAFYRAGTFPSNRMREAFEFSKARIESLSDLIRGSGFPPEESASTEIDWESVADRRMLMQRLEHSLYQKLEAWVSNETEFKKQIEELAHESQVAAIIGRALIQPGMEEADDDDYVALAHAMITAAVDASAAAKNNNYQLASQAINLIGQSCTKCHDEYR